MTAFTGIISFAGRDAMVRTIYGEARGEPDEGKAAVAWVVRNRVEWPGQPLWWGSSLYGVCYRPYQFSCHNENDPNAQICKLLREDDPAYIAMGEIVDAVLAGTIEDPTGGATHYKVTGSKASWDTSAAKVPEIVIGRHSFYKLGPHA